MLAEVLFFYLFIKDFFSSFPNGQLNMWEVLDVLDHQHHNPV